MRSRSGIAAIVVPSSVRAFAAAPCAVTCDTSDLTLAIRGTNAAGGGTITLGATCTYTVNDACLPTQSNGRCQWGDLGFLMGPNGLPAITSTITLRAPRAQRVAPPSRALVASAGAAEGETR